MRNAGRIISTLQTYRLPRRVRNTITRVLDSNLTYLPKSRLVALALLCQRLEREAVPGIMVEAGCALGGSTIVLAASKRCNRCLYVHDVFGMIPPPDKDDGADSHARYESIRSGQSRGIRGDKYYGYQVDLYSTVLGNLSKFGHSSSEENITFVKGDVEETLTLRDEVCLAHIDVDWYRPVRVCIERLAPRLARGGVMVFDDYLEWSGCRKAVDEYFKGCSAPGFTFSTSSGSLTVTKE